MTKYREHIRSSEKPHGRARRTLFGAALVVLCTSVLAAPLAAGAARTAAPSNNTLPSIKGKAREGESLTARTGDWDSASKIDYSYQWRVCNAKGDACSSVKKATDKLYTVRKADVGDTIRVVVTAVNADGATSAISKPTDVIKAAPEQAPTNTKEPTISGKTQQGETLTVQSNWSGTQPIKLAYRWRRCDDKGGDCAFITGANEEKYILKDLDVGKTMRVLVTASNSAGKTDASSNATSVIKGNAPSPPPPSGTCTAVAKLSPPTRLVVDRISYTPNKITSRSEPLIARFRVAATGTGCVSGALVYAVGVPFDRLSPGKEVQTDANGFATIRFTVLPTFQLRPGNLVVIFVRARKPGDPVLTGISSRRLVSVRVG